MGGVDLVPAGWHHGRVPRTRAWLTMLACGLAFVLALGARAHRADAQAFKPRGKTGAVAKTAPAAKKPGAATTTTAAKPAATPTRTTGIAKKPPAATPTK